MSPSPVTPAREKTRHYKFKVEQRWFTMPDGVRLAATLYIPKPKFKGEVFPVLLEYLPYRKDDTFYVVDYPTFSYFAKLGFIAVKVDIRGTGGSDGHVPIREYSDIELADGEEVIKQLAESPEANRKVGMFGVSWSGFNSLQMAMRRPPYLEAIHAVHASDDLYNDDVHYVDGNLHLDPYHLFINHELALPRTPSYKLDEEYFATRFSHRPWMFTYLSQQRDGHFWRRKSLREDPSRIDIPVYLIGGLLDGYRSATVRMFNELTSPVRCDIGPWEHSCPDDGSPGPNFEWQDRLAQWFNRYLRDDSHPVRRKMLAEQRRCSKATKMATEETTASTAKTSPAHGKEFMVYVRHGHKPDPAIETVPGYWRADTLPAAGTRAMTYGLSSSGLSQEALPCSNGDCGDAASVKLNYNPAVGTRAEVWWGNRVGDMRADDERSMTFDSEPVSEALQIIGSPRVNLTVKTTSEKAKWTLRLEDVAPDGASTLITGVLVNPALLAGRLTPAWPAANQEYAFEAALHFTTWTFQPGHKIRLAVANAQFPIAWPTPELMVGEVVADGRTSSLTLPVVPTDVNRVTGLPRVKEKLYSPDSEGIEFPGKPDRKVYDKVNKTGRVSHVVDTNSAQKIRNRSIYSETRSEWSTDTNNPADSQYLGIAQTTYVSRGLRVKMRTRILVRSDKDNFYVSVTRTLTRNGKRLAVKRFRETIVRQFQ